MDWYGELMYVTHVCVAWNITLWSWERGAHKWHDPVIKVAWVLVNVKNERLYRGSVTCNISQLSGGATL